VKLTSVKAKSTSKVELKLKQDPQTLVYTVSIARQQRIRELLGSGMDPRIVIDTVHREYGGNEASIKTQVYWGKREMEG